MKSKLLFLLFIVFLGFLAISFIPKIFFTQEEVVTPALNETRKPQATVQSSRPKEELLQKISEIIQKEDAKFAIEVYELKTGKRYGVNQEEVYHAASVGKLIVAVYALNQVNLGKATLDQIVDGASLRERLRLMINQSDNGSWESLLSFFGYSAVHKFEQDLGLTKSNVNGNTSTAKDINDLLAKIYGRDLLNEEHRRLLLGFMQNTEREERIPQAVPKGVTLYHKAGTFGGETHDAGIVIHPKEPFAITIFSVAKYDTSATLREIVKVVYDFLSE